MGIFASVGLGGSGVFYMLLGLCAVVATETLVKAYKCDASFGRLEGVQKNTVLLFMQSWGLWMMYCGAGCVMTLRMGNAKSTSAMCTIMFLANAMQIAVTELLMTETMTAMGMPDEGKHFNYALFGTFGLCCLLAGPGLPNIGALSSSPYALYSVATGLLFGLNMLFNQDELLAQYKFQADGSADYKYWVTIIMYGIGTCLLVLVLQCLALSGSDRMTKMGFIRIGWCMSMCIMVCSALQKTFNAQAGLMQDNMVEFTIGPVDVALKGPDVNVILQFTGGLLAYREMVAGDKAELEKLKKN